MLVNRGDSVVFVTINRAEVLNAMTSQMFIDFGDLCRLLHRDDSVRAVVITGAGQNFCSGADVTSQSDRVTNTTSVVPLRNMRRNKESA